MPFAGVGGTSVRAGYQIANSLRFNDNDSSNLNITPSGAGNRDTFTTSFWIKRGNLGSGQRIWSAGTSIGTNNNNVSSLLFESNDTLKFFGEVGGVASFTLQTNQVFRDVGAWYHIVLAVDTTQSTSSNRVKIYVNGSQITSFSTETYMSQNTDTFYNATNLHTISYSGGGGYVDGYIAEFVHIDGQQLSPTDFGEFDEDSGIWKPKQYTGSYGTNGFYLDFENSGSLGADVSGNGNNFTPTNLASTDQTTDTPTNNFATWNPLDKDLAVPPTLSEGNTRLSQPASGTSSNSNFGVPSGKWYFECKMTTLNNPWLGIVPQNLYRAGSNLFVANYTIGIYAGNPTLYKNGSSQGSLGGGLSSGDIVMIAFDIDNGNFYVGKNGLWNDGLGGGFDQANFSNATAHTFTVKTGDNYVVGTVNGSGGSGYVLDINFGNPSFSISSGNTDSNGYGNFEYAPPSGYLALCTKNLATALSPTIDDGSQYFNTVLYTGTGGTQSISGVGFQPDFVWLKDRVLTYDHQLHDSNRGASAGYLASNNTNTENPTYPLSSFDNDGWTTVSGGTPGQNASGDTFVSWNWKASAGSTSSNTDGSITSTVQANTTSGFSIITYTGTGASGSVGHGLTKAPEMVICKQRTDAGTQWQTGHTGLTNWTYKLLLNATTAQSVNANVFPSAPTSTVINLGLAGDSNGSGKSQLIYAFHSVEGYSKFGSYTGNGSSDGTFIYTGFRPAFILRKRTDTTGAWLIQDNKRTGFNRASADSLPSDNDVLRANDSTAEEFNNELDILSNGFKLRATDTFGNASGGSYIYACFGANPFVSSGAVPVVAR